MVTLAWPAQADTRMPVSLVKRTLTLQDGTLRIDGGPRWVFPSHQINYSINPGSDGASFTGGATYGFTRDLQAGAVIPLDLANDVRPLDPTAHVLYRFAAGSVELGGFASVNAPIDSERFWLLLGLPAQVPLGTMVRLDTGGFFNVAFDPSVVDLMLPVILPIQLSRATYLGPETGIILPDLGDPVLRAGAFIGYALAPDGQLLGDLKARIVLPDVSNTDVIQISAGFDLYFDL